MRRRLIQASLLMTVVVCLGIAFYLKPPPVAGTFPASFSEAEKYQVLSAANHDAVKQIFKALRHGRFAEARRWAVNSRKQTVRAVGAQGSGRIWVHFGIDEPSATDGYATWAGYIMKLKNNQWVIEARLF